MARNFRSHIPADPLPEAPFVPKHLAKQEFGRRLYQLMLRKGWSQSELARQANLARDLVSTYIRGVSMPSPQNLKALTDALGTTAAELLPNVIETAIDNDNPAFELRASPGAPNMAWLRVNRLVSFTTGLKIAELLDNDPLANGDRSSDAPSV